MKSKFNKKNPFRLSYGTGNVEGNLAKDKVCFDQGGSVCIDQVKFVAANSADQIAQDEFSGIVGLSPGFNPNQENGYMLPSFIE